MFLSDTAFVPGAEWGEDLKLDHWDVLQSGGNTIVYWSYDTGNIDVRPSGAEAKIYARYVAIIPGIKTKYDLITKGQPILQGPTFAGIFASPVVSVGMAKRVFEDSQ